MEFVFAFGGALGIGTFPMMKRIDEGISASDMHENHDERITLEYASHGTKTAAFGALGEAHSSFSQPHNASGI